MNTQQTAVDGVPQRIDTLRIGGEIEFDAEMLYSDIVVVVVVVENAIAGGLYQCN